MVKVKLFAEETTDTLEDVVNFWLAKNDTIDVINIQYQVREHAWCNYSVCITYRDTSKED